LLFFPHPASILIFLQNTFQWVTVNPGHWTGERGLESPSRAQPRMDDEGRLVGYRPAPNPLPSTPIYRHPADAHNRVRRDRILDGSDVRTTIMLRNIPNKMDWVCYIFPALDPSLT
jgi:hypothetical protein